MLTCHCILLINIIVDRCNLFTEYNAPRGNIMSGLIYVCIFIKPMLNPRIIRGLRILYIMFVYS